MTTNTKRIILAIIYLLCIILFNQNINLFTEANLISATHIGLLITGFSMSTALTVVYIILDKMLKESEKK
ncbi:hypothetical protein [Traorella massiliensis]|uniref:hypothetical protein n=1 Tax=Traorella massiliensis TaxID=1903263 RepID=UPI0008F90837|nr:hypothetical protein [Traorella massiliensis]